MSQNCTENVFTKNIKKSSTETWVIRGYTELTVLEVFSLATVTLIIVVVSLTIMHAEYVKWSKIPISRLPTIPTISSQRFDNLDEPSIFTKEQLTTYYDNTRKPGAKIQSPHFGKTS